MNKYYSSSIFCPSCRKMVKERNFIYECSLGEDEAHKTYKKAFDLKIGKRDTEIATSEEGEKFQFIRPRMRIFKANPKYAVCPVCRRKSYKLVCDGCEKPLSNTAHRTEVISVVGIKGCGKSVYIKSLINCLEKFFSSSFVAERYGFKPVPVTISSQDEYKLRPRKKLPSGTQQGLVEHFLLHIGNKDKGNKYPLDILIYDIAGEELTADNTSNKDARFTHLAMSSLIIFLFDSISKKYHGGEWLKREDIDEHRNHCMEGIDDDIDNKKVIEKIINMVTKIYEIDLLKDKINKLPIYLAACIASTDFLRWSDDNNINSAISPDDSTNAPGNYDYYYCYRPIDLQSSKKNLDKKTLNDMQKESSGAVKERLGIWGENNVLLMFEKSFQKVEYFGISSLGKKPELKENEGFFCSEVYAPRNVENPIVWFLDNIGIWGSLNK